MELGKFSISLTVKDIEKSLEFYTKFGFKIIDGGHTNHDFQDTDKMKWRILENGSLKVGLFQGMFQKNILTFHPQNVISIQQHLKSQGITFLKEADESGKKGSKTAILKDPDGNQIMLDQI